MPFAPPHICKCGKVVAFGVRCACQRLGDLERKRRFDRSRPSARARGYTPEWERERAIYLSLNPTCRRCGSPATVVHHIMAHKGNQRLFWNRANWFPACQPCHDGPLQSQEREMRKT